MSLPQGPSSSVLSTPAIDLDTTLGAIWCCFCFSWALFGIITFQTREYFRLSRDGLPTGVTALVVGIWIGVATDSSLIADAFHQLSILGYGNFGYFITLPISLPISGICNGLIVSAVNCYYAYRIHRISNHRLIPLLIVFLSVLFLFITVYGCISAALAKVTLKAYEHYAWTIYSGSVIRALMVLIASVALCVFLKLKSDSVKREVQKAGGGGVKTTTSRVVSLLILYTIQTGTLNALLAIASAIVYAKTQRNFVWIGVITVTQRFSVVCLLSLINARAHFQAMYYTAQPEVISLHQRTGSTMADAGLHDDVLRLTQKDILEMQHGAEAAKLSGIKTTTGVETEHGRGEPPEVIISR